MDIEQLKSTWRMMGERIDNLESENRRMAERLAAGKASTAQHRLARTALRGVYCGVLLPLLAPLLYYVLGFQPWIAVSYGIFGIVMAIVNIAFYRSIVRTDYMSLPLVDAMMGAVRIRTNLRRIRILSISLGLAIVFSLIFDTIERYEMSILTGMAVGFVCGLLIGLKKWHEQTTLSKAIIRELQAAMHEPASDCDIPVSQDSERRL